MSSSDRTIDADAPPIAASHARRSRWLAHAPFAAILLAFALFIFSRAAAGMTEPDDNGYFAQASLIYQTGHSWFAPASDAQYVGMHWLLTPDGTYVCRYPPGLPLLIAIVYAIGGWKACALVNPMLAVAALVGTYAAARRLTSTAWAIVAALIVATNPTFVRHALAADSHMAVCALLAGGVALLIAWQQRGRLWQIFAAGMVLGCIPSVRYPDALVALGVAAFLLANYRTWPPIWRHYGVACLGAAVPIVPLLVRNQLLLGGFWRTGYSLTNEDTGFGLAYFRQHAVQYVQTLNGEGLGLIFALGIAGLAWMLAQRGTRAIGALLALGSVPLVLLYMAYYWGPQGNAAMTMRFLVPTFPLFAIAGAWMLAMALRDAPRGARVVVPLAIVGVQLAWGGSTALENARQMAVRKSNAAALTDLVAQHVPADNLIIAGNAAQQQLDFVRRWKLADLALLTGRASGPGRLSDPERVAEAPSPQQQAKRDHQRTLYPVSADARGDKFERDVRAWAGRDDAIFLVGTDAELRGSFEGNYDVLGRITLPAPPQTEQRGAGVGRMGGGPPGMAGSPGGGNRQRGGPGGGGGGGGMMGVGAGGEYFVARWRPS